eukprot:gene10179-7130_t
MASCFSVLDLSGSPIIHRTYRGDINKERMLDTFRRRVLLEDESRITPVFEAEGYTYTYLRENNVYLLMVSAVNCLPLLQLAFMRSCVKVWEVYFRKVTEVSIRDSFVIVYELLDEMCDFGYPQFTEEKVLKEYITQEGMLSLFMPDKTVKKATVSAAVTGTGTPWRPPKKYSYSKNEAFLDVCERISMMMGRDGTVITSEIQGAVQVRTRLSGMPTMQVGLNDKALFDISGQTGTGVDLEDVQLHQCVNLEQFERERIISCVPPDGKFDLLTYRISKKVAPLVDVRCRVVCIGSSRVIIACTLKTTFRRPTLAKFVDVLIPIPSDADSPEARCSIGTMRYSPETNKTIWSLRSISGGREANCNVQYHLPSIRSSEDTALERAPVEVRFEIPYLAASGLQVRFVTMKERGCGDYHAVPWVRYLTQNGEYYTRIDEVASINAYKPFALDFDSAHPQQRLQYPGYTPFFFPLMSTTAVDTGITRPSPRPSLFTQNKSVGASRRSFSAAPSRSVRSAGRAISARSEPQSSRLPLIDPQPPAHLSGASARTPAPAALKRPSNPSPSDGRRRRPWPSRGGTAPPTAPESPLAPAVPDALRAVNDSPSPQPPATTEEPTAFITPIQPPGGAPDSPPISLLRRPLDTVVPGILKKPGSPVSASSVSPSRQRRRVHIDTAVQVRDEVLAQLKSLWARLGSSHHVQQHFQPAARGAVCLVQHTSRITSMVVKAVSLTQVHRAAALCTRREGSTATQRFRRLGLSWAYPRSAGAAYASLQHRNLTQLYGVLSADLPSDDLLYFEALGLEPRLEEPALLLGAPCNPTVFLSMRRDEAGVALAPSNGPYADIRRPTTIFGEQVILPEPAAAARRRVWSQDDLADLLWQTICGLRCLHRHDLPHGNVKPSNLLLADGGRLVLTDFGLPLFPDTATEAVESVAFVSRRRNGWEYHPYLRLRDELLTPGAQSAAGAGAGAGSVDTTPSLAEYVCFLRHFMAPECLVEADGDLYVDYSRITPGSDAYAVGVLFYWLSNGDFPPLPPCPQAVRTAAVGPHECSTTYLVDPPIESLTGPRQASSSALSWGCTAPLSLDSTQRQEATNGRGAEQEAILQHDTGTLGDVLEMLLHPDPQQRLSLGAVRIMSFFLRHGAQRHELLSIRERGRKAWKARAAVPLRPQRHLCQLHPIDHRLPPKRIQIILPIYSLLPLVLRRRRRNYLWRAVAGVDLLATTSFASTFISA